MFKLEDLTFVGQDLDRPECVLATQAGHYYVADFRGGVTQIKANGEQQFFGGETVPGLGKLKPNGIAMLPDGSFLVAHLGVDRGGVYKIERNQRISSVVTSIGQKPLPPSNFIYLDHQGRLWLTVSTRMLPRAAAYRSDVADGFICLIENGRAKIVADDIGYTNEVVVTPDGKTLYVNATFARETLAFDVSADGALTGRRVVAKYQQGIYPDGVTLDTEGYLWVTSIISNSLLRVAPASGEVELYLEDADKAHVACVEDAYQRHAIDRPHLDGVKSHVLQNVSSMAFAGPDLSTMVLGCLLGDRLPVLQSPFVGVAPAHWHFDDV